jgi:hypothetical protein
MYGFVSLLALYRGDRDLGLQALDHWGARARRLKAQVERGLVNY